MKQALVTMALSEEYKRIGYDMTFPIMEAYCLRYGLDFVNIDHCKRRHDTENCAAWERLIWMYKLLEKYDRVIHAEVDVILARDARDILEILPPGTFYGFDEATRDHDRCETFLRRAELEQGESRPVQQTLMYNSGAFVCDKKHREMFRLAANEQATDMIEMALMNLRLTAFRHKDVSPDFINLSYELGDKRPDLLHIAWEPGSKYDAVKRFMGRMGW